MYLAKLMSSNKEGVLQANKLCIWLANLMHYLYLMYKTVD